DFKVDQKSCEERGCVWDGEKRPEGVPFCYLDPKRVGYKRVNMKNTTTGVDIDLQLKDTSRRTLKKIPQIESLRVEVSFLTDRILRVKIVDTNSSRYEVPVQKEFPLLNQNAIQFKDLTHRSVVLYIAINCFKSQLIYRQKMSLDWERIHTIHSDMTFPSIRHLGFSAKIIKQERNKSITMASIPSIRVWKVTANLMEFFSSTAMLWLFNKLLFPTDYTTLPEPGLSFRTSGGVIDLFMFIGDNPEHVIQLYTSLIGRPILPPFWALGYQLTRWGFNGTDNVRQVIDRNIKAKVPLDVMYLDIDYMDQYHDFSYDKKRFAKLPELIDETKSKNNLHWTLILDPAIEAVKQDNPAFEDGYSKDVFIKWDPSDMNEPSNLIDKGYICPKNKYDYPDVRIKPLYGNDNARYLSEKTICMLTRQGDNNELLHYNVHSLYGWSELIATQKAIHAATGKRGFAVSRSTYVSSGRYGTHWLGDNASQWPHMKYSIIGILEFNLFGISFVGPDICGFGDNTTPELCKRWHQLGAFYPFSRNHNAIGNIDQDPAVWIERGHPEVTEAAINSLGLRYKLLPYMYTLFFKAHTIGQTVARPVFHEFPTDSNTYGIDEQFMLGSALLISPFLYQNQSQVKAYLPNTVWYEMSPNISKVSKTGYIIIDDNKHGIPPVHLRGGSIIPVASDYPHVNTITIRNGSINLLVLPDASHSGSGDLYWDDGDSIDTTGKALYNYYSFVLHKNCSLDINVVQNNYKTNQILESIQIYGTNGDTVSATLDGQTVTDITVHQKMIKMNAKIDLKSKTKGNKWTVSTNPAPPKKPQQILENRYILTVFVVSGGGVVVVEAVVARGGAVIFDGLVAGSGVVMVCTTVVCTIGDTELMKNACRVSFTDRNVTYEASLSTPDGHTCGESVSTNHCILYYRY
ncbi:unnamed protein product, partial [Medioppia subpectinata]